MSKRSSWLLSAALIMAMVVIFMTDLLTMLGFAHGMLYVLVVLIAMASQRRDLVITTASISVALTIAGLFLSPVQPESFSFSYVLANRGVSILVIVAAAALALARLDQLARRVATEQALKDSDRMLQAASEVSATGGWSVRLEPPAIHWTEQVHRIHGTEPGQEPALDEAIEFYEPEFRDRIRTALERCTAEGIPFDEELRIISKSGQSIWVRAIGHPTRDEQGHIVGAHGAFMDIDEAKRTARRLTTTLESLTDAFFLLDRDWRFTFVNTRAEALMERRREVMLGKSIWDEFPEAVDSVFEKQYRQALATGRSVEFEAWYPPMQRWLQVHAYPSDEGLAVYFQDITRQREADQQLRLLEAAIGQINDVVIITEADDIDQPGPRIVFVNQAFERLTGYRQDEVIGHSPRFLQGPETDRQELDRIRQALEHNEPVRAQLCNYSKDGTPYWLEIDIVLIAGSDGEGRYFVSVQRNITERLKIEEQLRQSQRLEAVGQLTGGIAHDFNNLLTVILGNAELLREELVDNPGLRSLAEIMTRAAGRGAELTQRLLAFARRQPLDPRPLDVNRLIAQMDSLLRRTLGDHIEIELARGGGLWLAMVDEGQLESAMLNLCLNARDAMVQGGRLTIETANARLDHDYAESNSDVDPGQYVMIAVSDTGRGIPAEDLPKVFEPFFTTKEKGKGTGLGLSMIYGFIKQSSGHIKIYSEVGEGTTVRMYLPRAHEQDNPNEAETAVARPETGSETILLVEDDDMVREYALDLLQGLGYQVLIAADGLKALDLIRTHAHIDLLFTDVMMPGGMSGRQLADQARELRPDLRVLYTSGYTENAIVHHGRLDPGVDLLSKPYRRSDLAHRIRAALRRPHQPPRGK